MSRRSNRKVKSRTPISYKDNHSDDSDEDLQLITSTISKRQKSGINRKAKKTRKTPFQTNSRGGLKTSSAPNSSTITLDDTILINHSKMIEDKVNTFFKSHNLVSDDEDEDPKNKNYFPQKCMKVYVSSDSEDDFKVHNLSSQPSTSYIHNKPETSSKSNKSFNLGDSKNTISVVSISRKEDEVINVDKILESSSTSIKQSLIDHKNKTADILGSISNLFDEISSNTNSELPKPPIPDSPKRTCPVCLETLCGEVEVMSTTCGHIFCKTCIDRIVKTIKRCPTCRKVVNKKKVHKIFL